MFGLEKHDARITNLNLRKERHGEDEVAACDISVSLKSSALILDTFDKKLRKAFFEKPGKGEQQALPIDGNNLTALALPYLKEQKLDQKFDGYEARFDSLLEHIEPLFFADAKVKLEKVTFIEGGSVDIALKVSTVIAPEEDAELLAAWRRGEVLLTLTPPDAAGEKQDGQQQEAA